MEHLAPVHSKLSAILVTTPQAVALTDMGKCLSFTQKVNLPIAGLIENMSGFVCPCCGEVTNVFSTGGGEEMAKREGLPFLGALPVDTQLVELLDASVEQTALEHMTNGDVPHQNGISPSDGQSFHLLSRYRKTPTFKLFEPIVQKVITNLTALSTVDQSTTRSS